VTLIWMILAIILFAVGALTPNKIVKILCGVLIIVYLAIILGLTPLPA